MVAGAGGTQRAKRSRRRLCEARPTRAAACSAGCRRARQRRSPGLERLRQARHSDRGALRLREGVGARAGRRRSAPVAFEDSMAHAPPAVEVPAPQLATRDAHTLLHGYGERRRAAARRVHLRRLAQGLLPLEPQRPGPEEDVVRRRPAAAAGRERRDRRRAREPRHDDAPHVHHPPGRRRTASCSPRRRPTTISARRRRERRRVTRCSVRLHVNVDHVATLRNARGTLLPRSRARARRTASRRAPTASRRTCAKTGATSATTTSTACARSARSHQRTFNLEMAATDEMVAIAHAPEAATCARSCPSGARSARPRAASTSWAAASALSARVEGARRGAASR